MASLLHVRSAPAPPSFAVDHLRAEGVDVIESSPAAEEMTRAAGGEIAAVLISPDVDAPLSVARAVHEAHPDAHIVFVTTPAREAILRRDLLLAPRIGKHWSITTAEAAEGAVRSALGAVSQRRKVQHALSRMNVRLADSVAPVRPPVFSEHLLASILSQLSDGIIAVDNDDVVMTHNAAATRMLGPDLRQGAVFRLKHGEIEVGELSIELRSSAIEDDAGHVLGAAIVARDVTDRRREEQQKAFLATAVATLASTLDADLMLQHLADLVVRQFASVCAIDIIDGDVLKRKAVAAEDHLQRIAHDLWRFSPPRNSQHPSLLAIREGSVIVRNDLDDEMLRDVTINDEHRSVITRLGVRALLSAPLRAGERTVGAMLLASDRPFSSGEAAAAEELARSAAAALQNAWLYHAAEEANRAKDEFLATVSHELRTPMTSILGWIQMIRIGALDAQMTKQAMESIEQSARAQAQLIDDILDVSRIEAGKLHLQIEDTDLASVVRAAAETVRPAANAKEISIEMSIDPSLPPVTGDPNRLQQVVWNLLNNAVKFTPKRGRVAVAVDATGSKARICVSDNGTGITPDFLPFVFDRFRQADSSVTRRFGGLGLGLSIVRQIVELHGGTVLAESEGEGKGATFTVTLPVAALRNTQVRDDQEPLADLTGMRILVVDDDQSAAEVISAVLAHAGAEVEARRSMAEALDAIRLRLPDILVSDIAMPDQDGYMLIEHVRRVLRLAPERLPALALTAMADVDTRVRILDAGFQHCMRKPVDAHELIRAIARVARR